jgi:Tfp pilus assembly protein PilN
MIQFNLLPDVKVDYMKTQRTKRMVMIASLVSAAVSILILVVTFSYSVTQKRHLANLSSDIKSIKAELEGNSELTKILSVQNQLETLPALYDGRPAVNRLPIFIEQTTPVNIGLGKTSVDFSTSKFEITGSSDSLGSVNAYVDTLKFTKFKSDADTDTTTNAFKDVVLSKFGTKDGVSTFVITLTFDPLIFDETKKIELLVPTTVTTRAQSSSSEGLFNGQATTPQEEGARE